MADTIEIVQGTATTVEVAGPTGPQGPAGAAGASQADVLTVQGDLLYRGASAAARLGIGSSGQVLKVSGGIPAWGAESGAVSSVAGRTGAVTLAVADVADAVATSDARLSDARTPSSTLAHASTHHTGGTDAIAPNNISAAWALVSSSSSMSGNVSLSAGRARHITYTLLGGSYQVTLPLTGNQAGDICRFTNGPSSSAGAVLTVLRGNAFGGTAIITTLAVGQTATLFNDDGSEVGWRLEAVDTHTHPASAISDSTTAGRALLTGADAAAQRTSLGLGTAATANLDALPETLRIVGGTDATKKLAFEVDTLVDTATTRTLTVPNASGTIALTGQLTDTQIFTANDTWTKPTGAKLVHYLLIGGGGGGGAGRRSLQGNALGGGGGGAGGGITAGYVDPAFLNSTESITVGAGGAGAADSADNTNGASGTAGGESSLGSFIKARGGAAGGGGSSSAGSAGAATTLASIFYGTNASTAAGASGGGTTGATAVASVYLPTGGGGGGARGSSINYIGGKGGDIGQTNTGLTSAPAVAAGTNGPTGIRSQSSWAGTGGGGGSMSSDNAVHTGFSGGNGGLYGGGGGGGSGAVNASGGSSAGGTGGAGIVIVTTYF